MRRASILHTRAPAINVPAHSHLYKVMMVILMFVTPAINELANSRLLMLFLLTSLVNAFMKVATFLRGLVHIFFQLIRH